ncbi:hypothetical protein RJ641_025722, partial [Dillenia turbinata]
MDQGAKEGELILEKAKEHDLVCLKCQWAQNVKIAASKFKPKTITPQEFEKPKKTTDLENMKLHIFFPKFRKVKRLPFSGFGKHKYNFPQADILFSIPLHFWGCEEHSDFSYMPKGTNCDSDTHKDRVDEQKFNIMNMVINRLFERDSDSKTLFRRTDEVASEKPIITLNPLINDNEANDMTVDDNLITNIINGDKNIDVLETRLDKSKTFKDPQTQHHRNTKRKITPSGATFPTSNERKKLNSIKEWSG